MQENEFNQILVDKVSNRALFPDELNVNALRAYTVWDFRTSEKICGFIGKM